MASSTSWPLTAQQCVLNGTRTIDGWVPWQEIFERAGIDETALPKEMTEKRERIIGEEILNQAMRMRGRELAQLKFIVFQNLWRYHHPHNGDEEKGDRIPSNAEIIDGSMEDLRDWIFDHPHFPGNILGEIQHLMPDQDADYQTQVAISLLDGDNFNRLFNRYAATTCLPLVPNPNPFVPPSAI